MATKRKIIQIAACGHENTSTTQSTVSVFALADDGTLWATDPYHKVECWHEMQPLPDDE